MSSPAPALKRFAFLLGLTVFSVAANGYHYAADDAGIYLAAVLKYMRPSLYPANSAFIRPAGSYSIFPALAAAVTGLFNGSLPASAFFLHCLGIFVLLAAALNLAEKLFPSKRATWAAVIFLAGMTSIYVAGTSIPIMDPYLSARTLSTPLSLLAFTSAIEGNWALTLASLALALAIHPLMGLFATLLIASYLLCAHLKALPSVSATVLPFAIQGPAAQAMQSRSFFFANQWSWLDWIGVAVPMAAFFTIRKMLEHRTNNKLRDISFAALFSGGMATALFLFISFDSGYEALARLQPMRMFQLIYILFYLVLGGFMGEYLLQRVIWRWALLFIILGFVNVALDHHAYPASSHLELPGAASSNPWVQSFEWARAHTSENALFALPPNYVLEPSEDKHGFRAIAERSSLADEIKDSGVVSIFPSLAPEWKKQIDAQSRWNAFSRNDFERLAQSTGITWVIVQVSQSHELHCGYRNAVVAVCRVAPQ